MKRLSHQLPRYHDLELTRPVEDVWRDIRPYTTPIWVGEQGYLPDGRPLVVADATGLASGSFKERGALAKMLELQRAGAQNVVTASAGNHSAGVAMAARVLGMHVQVFMPHDTPEVKVDNTYLLGGDHVDIEFAGREFEETRQAAEACAATDRPMVQPFDDLTVARGQGTVAHELLMRYPHIDHLLVPAGGGGLAAGCVEAIKQAGLRTKVYGVKLSAEHELCEGANVKELGDVAVQIATQYPDNWGGVWRVDPADVGAVVAVEDAVRAEHAAAMGEVAYDDYPEATALLGVTAAYRYFDQLPGTVAVVVTGRNADQTKLNALYERFRERDKPIALSNRTCVASGYQLRFAV